MVPIAVTLLALEIRLPERHEPTTRGLRRALLDLLPQFYGFATGFWIIGVYRMAHHRISISSTAAAGYALLLLIFVRPVTNLYARRRLG